MRVDFLICSERSGSNLITKIIDNHSAYCGPTPSHLLRVFALAIDKYGNLMDDTNWNNFINDIYEFHSLKIGVWETQVNAEELFSIENRTLADVVKYIYNKEARFHKKPNVLIKEVKTYRIAPLIQKSFPDSKFIWVVRDPRDMALSWSKSPVHRGDIVRAAGIWKEDQKHTLELYGSLKKSNKICLIKYEELITNHLMVLNKVCEFLEIDFEPDMLEFYTKDISVKNSLQTDNWKNLNKKIMINNSSKFLKHLTENQIRYIEYICNDEMQLLDYKPHFPLISNAEFNALDSGLRKLERNEKPEYETVSKMEKTKREKWYKKFLEIQNNKI